MKIKKRVFLRNIKKGLFIFLIILFFSFFNFFLFSNFWAIKRINCNINNQPCSGEMWTELMSLAAGKNIIFFRKKFLNKKIFEKYSNIKEIEVKKKFPDELEVDIKKREPVVAVAKELDLNNLKEFLISGDFFLVDKEGKILENKKETDLPLILLENTENLKIGDKLEKEEIIKIIEMLIQLKINLYEPQVAKIISKTSFGIWLKDNTYILFSSKRDSQLQLDSLQLIYSRAKIEGVHIKRVDLRFDKPVITYEQ